MFDTRVVFGVKNFTSLWNVGFFFGYSDLNTEDRYIRFIQKTHTINRYNYIKIGTIFARLSALAFLGHANRYGQYFICYYIITVRLSNRFTNFNFFN